MSEGKGLPRAGPGPVPGEIHMLLSVLGLAVMQVLVRYLGGTVSAWTKTFYRSFFTVVIILAWMLIRREKIRVNNRPLLVLRSITGAVSITFFFWAIDLVGLFTATLYLYVHPVFAIVFASLFFKDRHSLWILLPLAGALAGLYFIVNPRFEGFGFGHIIGLSMAVIGGVARASLGELRRTDAPSSIVLIFMCFTAALSGGGAILLPGQSWRFAPEGAVSLAVIWLLLAAIGLLSAASHILVTVAFHRLTTAKASIMTMLILPLTALAALFFFDEPFGLRKLVGAVLITLAGIGVSFVPPARD